jgi:tetratricopeptide (TPR) repeat protein
MLGGVMRAAPIVGLIALMCASAVLAGQTQDENWKRCAGSDPAARISGCTALLQANRGTNEELATAYMDRGTAYTVNGNYDRAIEDLSQSLRLNPKSAEAFYNRGYAFAAKGDDENALKDYDDALRLNPNFVFAYRGRGNVYVDQGNYERALQDFNDVVRLSPDDPIGFELRGGAYDYNGDFDLALQDFDQAARLNPKSPDPLLERGLVYVHKQDYDRAIQDYNQVVQMNPGFAAAYDRRGYAYYRKHDLDRAMKDFDQAIKLDPKNYDALDNRANAYDDKGEFDKALKDYAEALRLVPNDPVIFIDRGLAYSRKGDLTRAIQDYDQALELNPKSYTATMDRGDAYVQKGDYDRAILDYNQALQLLPHSIEAVMSRGGAFFSKEEYDRAITDFDEAVRLDPKSADALTDRGNAYMGKKDTERAIQDYNQALLLDPKNVATLTSRSQAYTALGQYTAAANDLIAALREDPAYPYYSLWLYVARVKSGQDGRAELEKNAAAQKKLTEWPGPVFNLFLGKTTPEVMLAAASNPDAKKDHEQHCEAYFYLGEYALMKGNAAEAKRFFQQSVDTGVKNFIEYADAQVELKRMPAGGTEVAVNRGFAPEPANPVATIRTGKYYALVIGINQYRLPMPGLKTAVADAQAVAKDLREIYGFEVKLLLDGAATRVNILEAITDYRNSLGPNDNLLIYYAGHGYSDKDADKAYWLPVDADSSWSPNRISADDLTSGVRVQLARHVLIISDSCYSGDLSRDADVVPRSTERQAYERYLQRMLDSRSRTIMASGGDEPVSDGGSGGHSVFAYELLQSLEHVDEDMFTAGDLFSIHLKQRVGGNSQQQPRYDIIRASGHDEGDFVFVRHAP